MYYPTTYPWALTCSYRKSNLMRINQIDEGILFIITIKITTTATTTTTTIIITIKITILIIIIDIDSWRVVARPYLAYGRSRSVPRPGI